jgi:hypothetical protein
MIERAEIAARAVPGEAPRHWEGVTLIQEASLAMSAKDGYSEARALATRMLVFYALKGEDPNLPRKLKLIRRSVETGARSPRDQDKPYFWELHSGFVYGGRRLAANSGGGYDCSDFMASLLSGHGAATGLISSYTLKSISHYLAGDISRSSLSKSAKELLPCFEGVNVRKGEAPQAGDLVVSNNETLKDGHVTIVKRYLGDGAILTIEDSGGGANTIMSKVRPLYEPPPVCSSPEPHVPVRPDLYVLRFKSPKPASCPISVGTG